MKNHKRANPVPTSNIITPLICNNPIPRVFPARLAPLVDEGVDIELGRIVFRRALDEVANDIERDPIIDDNEDDWDEALDDTDDEIALEADDREELPDNTEDAEDAEDRELADPVDEPLL